MVLKEAKSQSNNKKKRGKGQPTLELRRNLGKGKASKGEVAEGTFKQRAKDETVSVHDKLVHGGRGGKGVGWRWHRWQEAFS